MIERSHQKGDAASVALYSDCERYRYALTRIWEPKGQRALFIMLNPSTATEVQNDPTVERCERRARALGFGAFRGVQHLCVGVTLIRARCAPLPNLWGPENDAAIVTACDWADRIICAWGTHGAHLERGAAVTRLLRSAGLPLWHLGAEQGGSPKTSTLYQLLQATGGMGRIGPMPPAGVIRKRRWAKRSEAFGTFQVGSIHLYARIRHMRTPSKGLAGRHPGLRHNP